MRALGGIFGLFFLVLGIGLLALHLPAGFGGIIVGGGMLSRALFGGR